jgi:hypothetical protein
MLEQNLKNYFNKTLSEQQKNNRILFLFGGGGAGAN